MKLGIPEDKDLFLISNLFRNEEDTVDISLISWKEEMKDFSCEHMEICFYVPKKRLTEINAYFSKNSQSYEVHENTLDYVRVNYGGVIFGFYDINYEKTEKKETKYSFWYVKIKNILKKFKKEKKILT